MVVLEIKMVLVNGLSKGVTNKENKWHDIS